MKLKKQLILASGSPRRREILDQAGFSFKVVASDFDEDTISLIDPIEFAKTLAYKKAESIACKTEEYGYVIGADTLVVVDGNILGKPHDELKSADYLRMLSGRSHQVVTGISLIRTWDKKTISRHMITQVVMESMSEDDIKFYTGTKEPFDKAGAYGIQGIGSRFVKEIRGDYFNVVGLPVNLLVDMLKEMGEVHESFSKQRINRS